MTGAFRVVDVKTAPIDGQKTGTSGLRKKVAEFKKPHYLANWVQSLFSSIDGLKGSSIALGGDGRYWNKDAVRIICRIAAANGVARVLVGQNGILCTPALSAIVRRRELLGGIILTASHNPGGPNADFGIKYNVSNGGPAPESVTDKILTNTKTISTYGMACVEGAEAGTEADPFASVDLSVVGTSEFKSTDGAAFTIDVVDSATDYVELLQSMFDFEALKTLFARSDFSFLFDAMSGVTGPYAKRIFVELLGGPSDCVMRGEPLEDFGGAHPDPNLTYAADLVASCDPKKSPNAPAMGAASDGDGDRNMILGRGFFVTPSDSLAVIAAKAKTAIPFFKDGLTGVARSMPTASAVDHVATKMGISCFETPTGWKFFGNLLDAGKAQICGEESFGTGAFHVREKDGIFAVLCWLAVLAHENASTKEGELISIESIVTDHWKVYGRNFFSRYDYEEVDSDAGAKLMATVTKVQEDMATTADSSGSMTLGDFPVKVTTADNFSYTDPIDGSVAKGQGLRFVFADHSRLVFRLSGTGSSGATIRLYAEQYETDEAKQGEDAQVALKPLIDLALKVSNLTEITGRSSPTVIT